MELDKVNEIVLKIIANKPYNLYAIKEEKVGTDNILQIFIDKEPAISLAELATLNELISNELDKIDASWPPYMLEVSSPGAEKELKGNDDILKSVGKYIHVELIDKVYEGYLEEANDLEIIIKINLKGRIKKLPIKINDIKFIRLAVKI